MSIPKLISADSHVIEPPDIWTARLPEKYRDRAPKQIRGEQGDQWQFPSSPPWPYGLNQCGGLSPEHYSVWIKWENVRAEAYKMPERTAGVLNDAEFDVAPDGSFELILGGPAKARGWLALADDATRITVRHYWEQATPPATPPAPSLGLAIDLVGGDGERRQSGQHEPHR